MQRRDLSTARRWVVKIGSSLVTNQGRGLNRSFIESLVEQVIALHQAGSEVVLVSSGAVAEGVVRLGWKRRPHSVHQLQAAAAVGQMGLVQAYETCFQAHGLHTAQVLLTHEDISGRQRYLNARSTLRTLLALGVVPVINENDTVAVEEIQFGDNDRLGGLVSNLVEADVLVILTDQAGLMDKDPRLHADAKLIAEAAAGDPTLEAVAGEGGSLGRGGMCTKLAAANLAARSGTATVIVSGHEQQVLQRIQAGDPLGTRLWPAQKPLGARKRWLAGQLQPKGEVLLDAGAAQVLTQSGRSLLSVGVTGVRGLFRRGELVSCVDPTGREVARGLVNYSSEETARLAGVPSEQIESVLGYVDEAELIHRDNLVLI
jgi:glutamate 5-kinase